MLPSKKAIKYNFNIDPPKIGTEYLKYGFDRIEELMIKTDQKTNYLPRTIEPVDIDNAIFEYVESGNLHLVIDGKDVPTFYLENDRWGEFSKTWKFMDGDKNVLTPYLTVRRTRKGEGTRLGKKYRIPQPRTFRYLDVPILDEGQLINLRFKMPEPTNVDFTYEIRLFTKYRVDLNEYDKNIFKNFASRQGYIWVKGTPFPVHLENVDETNTIENIDGDRFFVGVYTIKALAFIQDEKEFEITKTVRRLRLGYLLDKSVESGYRNQYLPQTREYIRKSVVSPEYNKIKVEEAGITNRFNTINDMILNQRSLKSNNIYYVVDASDDPNISSGYAFYMYNGFITGDISDFVLIGSQNAISNTVLTPYTFITNVLNQSQYTIIPAIDNEIFSIAGLWVGNSKQKLNDLSITTVNNINDTVVLNIGSSTIPIGTEIYLEYFKKI